MPSRSMDSTDVPWCGDQRVVAHLESRGAPNPDRVTNGIACLEWTGCRDRWGYGTVGIRYQTWKVHRAIVVAAGLTIPQGKRVLHRCDNPPCFRLAHLFIGTQADNVADMIAKGRHVGGYLGDKHWTRQQPQLVRRGEAHGRSKLTEAAVLDMRRRFRAGEPAATLGDEYGVAPPVAWRAITGQTWAYLPDAVPNTNHRGVKADRHWSRRMPELVIRGTEQPGAKITDAIVLEMRRRYAGGTGESARSLARAYGISPVNAWRIVTGRMWAHLPLDGG
jgi:HNH endonuclease